MTWLRFGLGTSGKAVRDSGCARSAYRKDGALHDPFAELTGLLRPAAKSSPPLKTARTAASTPLSSSGLPSAGCPPAKGLGGPASAAPATGDGFGGSAFAPAPEQAPAPGAPSATNGFETKFAAAEDHSGSLI